MRGAMLCSRWSGSPARTISMRPYLAAQAIEPSPQTGPPATKTGPNGRLLPATTKTLHGPSKGGDRAAALAACTQSSEGLISQPIACSESVFAL